MNAAELHARFQAVTGERIGALESIGDAVGKAGEHRGQPTKASRRGR